MTIDGAATLARSLEDTGVVVRYYGALLGRSGGSVLLAAPVEPSGRHTVMLFNTPGTMVQLSPLKSELHDRRWLLGDGPNADAWAIAYDGGRLGSGWREGQLASLIRSKPTVENFALLRWFKAPVLGREMHEAFLQAVGQHPVEFVRAWMGEDGLPIGLRHAEVPEELHSVIRAALWNIRVPYPNQATRIWEQFVVRAPAGTTQSEQEGRIWAAQRLAQLCPPFAGQVLTKIKKGNKLAKRAYRGLLGLADESPLGAGDAQLGSLFLRSVRSLGVDEASLGKAISELANGFWHGADEWTIRRLAESPEGARYLAAVVLRTVAEGNSHSWTPSPPRVRTASASSRT